MSWLGNHKILTLILSGLLIPGITGLVYFGVLKGKAEERLNCIEEKEKLKDENTNLKLDYIKLAASTGFDNKD